MKRNEVNSNKKSIPIDGDALGVMNALITERILLYNSKLIEDGQIKSVKGRGPSINPLPAHCNRSGHKPYHTPLTDLALQHGAPIQ